MKKYKSSALLCALLLGSSCQTNRLSEGRKPSSVIETEVSIYNELAGLIQKKTELDALSIHFEKKKRSDDFKKVEEELKVINSKIDQLEKSIKTLSTNDLYVFNHESKPWRKEEQELEISNPEFYEIDRNIQYDISTFETKESFFRLRHKVYSNANYVSFSADEDKPRLDFEVICDSPLKIKWGYATKKYPANKKISFSLGDHKLEADYRDFIFDENFSKCELSFSLTTDPKSREYKFTLNNESKKLSKFSDILSTTEICALNNNKDSFINNTEFRNLTCPTKYDEIEILPEPEDSLHARVKALLGRDLPKDFIKNGNPYAELDFSKAPKYDAILISYLVFRADFYGTLLARLLSYHADKGALVRIVVSDVISLKKDKTMYEKMMLKHPNMKFVLYEFDKDQKGGSKFAELHRTNHVKLFIAYSKENSEDSMAIIGGRNIHDGFVFKTPVDVGKYPEIVNYKTGDESWAYWRDFEMVIKGQDFVESLVRQYLSFYHINKENLVMKKTSIAFQQPNVESIEENSIRHYVSIPFKDGENLNQFYAKMIDTSKKKILISSPYFRPVKEIYDALMRAVDRGVDVTIITRLDLEGDTADFILGAVNKEGVNKFYDKVKVYEYTEPKVILHSKLLMIDDKESFISSVNLNKRSFYHDLENGVIIHDEKFTKKMGEVYKEYLKISAPITEKQKIEFWKKWIIKALDKVF